jgi:hypothetical protein
MGRREFFRYRACGMSIEADAPIAGARRIEDREPADVCVAMHGSDSAPDVPTTTPAWYVSPYQDEHGVPSLTIRPVGSSHLFCYGEGAQFLVSASGSRIDAWWDSPLSDADAADFLLSGVLAFVVRLRGLVPLHASAIVIDGTAVLFAGAAGAGKSSTAAAFAILGLPVLSDDVVTMADEDGVVIAHPASPRVSMWPDSAKGLFANQSLPPHSAVYAKHRLDLLECGYRFHERAAPVRVIFVLQDRSGSRATPATQVLTPGAALISLVTHTYGNYLLDERMRAREFDVLGRIAETVPVRELAFAAVLEQLVPNCQRLLGELQSRNGVGSHF